MAWATARIVGLIFLIGSISASKITKIVGGYDADIKQFPFIVSLRDLDGGHFCAGAIISDRHILTAAHCLELEKVETLRVHSGTSRTDKPGNVHKVISMTVHPTYEKREGVSTSDDLAILKLEEPIVFNKYQKKINLPTREVQEYEAGYAVGWGRISATNWELPTQLQRLRVALLPSKKCQPFLTEAVIDNTQICAVRNVEKSVCHGDSGGPLVSRGEIVGIVSRGDTGRCAVGIPDIFTNVFAHKEFIQAAMED